MMRDIPEFTHLKSFEKIIRVLEEERTRKKSLFRERLKTLCAPYNFTEQQIDLLAVMLKEKGFMIE